MAVGDVSGRERSDEETDQEITKDRGEADPPADRARERGCEKNNTDLEDWNGLGHTRRLLGGDA